MWLCAPTMCCARGAKPLFFLDYIATGKVKAEKIAGIVKVSLMDADSQAAPW